MQHSVLLPSVKSRVESTGSEAGGAGGLYWSRVLAEAAAQHALAVCAFSSSAPGCRPSHMALLERGPCERCVSPGLALRQQEAGRPLLADGRNLRCSLLPGRCRLARLLWLHRQLGAASWRFPYLSKAEKSPENALWTSEPLVLCRHQD